MQDVLLTILVATVMVALMEWAVLRNCRKNPVIAAWRPMLIGVALLWGVLFVLHVHVLPQFLPQVDSIYHDGMAKEVASQLRGGDLHSAFARNWFGNSGFQLFVGIIYAVTNLPQVVITAWFALMAFCGLLTLLDVIARGTGAVRLPFWVVLIIGLYPEGILWSMELVKEGLVLWGLCTMLRFVVPDPTLKGMRRWIAPTIGAAVFMILRPYVALPWLVAVVGVQVIRRRQWGVAALALVGVVASFLLVMAMAPDMWKRVTERGLVGAFEAGFRERMNVYDTSWGSSIVYDEGQGAPIPEISGLMMMFLRPFPHEAPHLLAFLSGMEVWILTATMLVSWLLFRGWKRLMLQPLVLTCIFATVFLAFVFTYQTNLGTMVRERIQVFPALIAFAAAPGLVRRAAQYRARQTAYRGVRPATVCAIAPSATGRSIRVPGTARA